MDLLFNSLDILGVKGRQVNIRFFLLLICITFSCANKKFYKVKGVHGLYRIVTTGHDFYPKWINAPSQAASKKNREHYYYFVMNEVNRDKKLCLRSLQSKDSKHLFKILLDWLKKHYEKDNAKTLSINKTFFSENKDFLLYLKVVRTYWELRNYEKDLGRGRNLYYCYSLVRINKNALDYFF